jgi:hypothetical protein
MIASLTLNGTTTTVSLLSELPDRGADWRPAPAAAYAANHEGGAYGTIDGAPLSARGGRHERAGRRM